MAFLDNFRDDYGQLDARKLLISVVLPVVVLVVVIIAWVASSFLAKSSPSADATDTTPTGIARPDRQSSALSTSAPTSAPLASSAPSLSFAPVDSTPSAQSGVSSTPPVDSATQDVSSVAGVGEMVAQAQYSASPSIPVQSGDMTFGSLGALPESARGVQTQKAVYVFNLAMGVNEEPESLDGCQYFSKGYIYCPSATPGYHVIIDDVRRMPFAVVSDSSLPADVEEKLKKNFPAFTYIQEKENFADKTVAILNTVR